MMRATVATVLVLLSWAAIASAVNPKNVRSHPPGGNLTVPQMIELQGYPAEIHHITTDDGYILEMHRIPHGINDEPSKGRPIAFLSHCLLCSSSDFIMNTPDKALAYMLADAGYDVWMNNFRGNTYSRKHTTLDPDHDLKYWAFTFGEMGTLDLAAMIDYTLETTGLPDLYYVGFSMGTTTFFTMMSEKPEYNDKVRVMIGMGPVANTQHIKGPIRWLSKYAGKIDFLMTLVGKGEFLPSRDITDQFVEMYCDDEMVTAAVCYDILFLIAGPDPALVDKEYLPLILTQTPAGTSFHTMNHYAQLVTETEFRMYDWGRLGNQEHYGQRTPPVYNLDNVKTPVAMFWGPNDWLAAPEDVSNLATKLPNVILNQRIAWDQFNHMDFVWAINAYELVYQQLMEVLSQY